jgi:hypothetical protein
MYAKIFLQIFDSSIVENPETRFTFMDLLVLADQNGVVDMTHEAIARRTNRPLELIRATIADLESPDPRSRTPDADGRRLNRLDEHRDWGWMIVNYDSFCKISSDEQRRQKNASRVAKYREKVREKKNSNAPVTPCNAPVTPCNAPVTPCNAPSLMSLHVDVPVDVPVSKNKTSEVLPSPFPIPAVLNRKDFVKIWENWLEHLKQKRKQPTILAGEMQLKKLESMGIERAMAALKFSIEGNYQGIFEPNPPPQKQEQHKPISKMTSAEILSEAMR